VFVFGKKEKGTATSRKKLGGGKSGQKRPKRWKRWGTHQGKSTGPGIRQKIDHKKQKPEAVTHQETQTDGLRGKRKQGCFKLQPFGGVQKKKQKTSRKVGTTPPKQTPQE